VGGGDRADRRVRFQLVARDRLAVGIDGDYLERAAFIEMPDFVRCDAVPAADGAGRNRK
jgi:hypothetical protein